MASMRKIIELRPDGQSGPAIVNGKVQPTPPARQTNAERRSREYLTLGEVETSWLQQAVRAVTGTGTKP